MARKPVRHTAGRRGVVQKAILVLAGLAVLPLALPTLILLFFGLLPTMAAAVAERGPQRYAWICVGGLNFAGLSPFLIELWRSGHTIDHALAQVTGVLALLLAYGAAAFGWLLYIAVPPVVGAVVQVAAQRRAQTLRTAQLKLVERWGPDVNSQETGLEGLGAG